MSAGGVFKLIANDGKADRMIMATKLLNQRIKDVMCARKAAGKKDLTPTLVDIERTHILFVNAHFKPFAAIGYEYNKVRPQSGNPALGNTITFSIPQFGDFFHDMVGRQVLSKVSSSDVTAPTQATDGSAINTTNYPRDTYDWDNTTQPSTGDIVYDLVDPFNNSVADGATYKNLVRYCEYPGERLYKSVKFDVNGNPLDEYNSNTINMLRKFTIGADKIVGYKRLVGQEVPREGFSGPQLAQAQDSNNTGIAPFTQVTSSVPNMNQNSLHPLSKTAAAHVAANAPDNAWSLTALGGTALDHSTSDATGLGYQAVTREYVQAVDGPQTPKYEQPALEIWNKLRFWFNDDARLSIASVSIPYGQRFITIDLAAQSDLVYEEHGLHVRQTIDSVGATTETTNTRVVYHRPHVNPGTIGTISLSNVELYVNNIFVNPEIHDIFIKRIGFSLIRVYRQHTGRSNNSSNDEKLLSQLKWPIEYMFMGLKPAWNTSSSNPTVHRDWHRLGKVMDHKVNVPDHAQTCAQNPLEATTANGGYSAGVNGHVSRVHDIHGKTYAKETKTVDSLSLTAHGINIHDNFPERFFSAYVPFHYGGPSIVTPDDEGALMINFALYPRSYNPSGHLNVSRAREFFSSWQTKYVDSSNEATLIAVAIAINFLLITDGSAVLRYST
jgi:hypothetical protein